MKTRRMRPALPLLVVLAASACGATDPIACTTQAVAGINVTVVDDATGADLADGATLVLSDGAWTESITEAFGGILSGAFEREGTYRVEVTREGYGAWSRTGVVVDADECHVIPVSIEARLTAG